MITWERAAENAAAPGRHQPFDEIDFVIVDVETTGWSPDEARITEIGAVRFRAGHQLGQFSSLVNPGRAIPERLVTLTGISDAMVAAAPPLDQVLPTFLAFAHGGVLTAHNAPFDVGFLRAACQACDLPWPDFPVVDTVELARLVLSEDEVPNCKLSTLAAFFGARTAPRHRALADALATADVLQGPAAPAPGGRCQHAGRDDRRLGRRPAAAAALAPDGPCPRWRRVPAAGWGPAASTPDGTLPAMAGHRRPRRQMWSPRSSW